MRKLVIGMALASTVLATPALARDNSWYAELDFGPMIVEDSDMDSLQSVLDSDYGYDGGGAIGYDFGAFRMEAEASYRSADHDELYGPAFTLSNPGGNANVLSFMLNGMLDFGPDDGIQGFVGGGSDKLAREDMFASQVPEFNANDLIGTDDTTADENFDQTHPIYETLANFAAVRGANTALQSGAQIHRFSTDSAGVYAFSRIDRDERVVRADLHAEGAAGAVFGGHLDGEGLPLETVIPRRSVASGHRGQHS